MCIKKSNVVTFEYRDPNNIHEAVVCCIISSWRAQLIDTPPENGRIDLRNHIAFRENSIVDYKWHRTHIKLIFWDSIINVVNKVTSA